MLLARALTSSGLRRVPPNAGAGWTPPYALPSSQNTSVTFLSNTLDSARPGTHSIGEIRATCFGAWCGPTFVPTYSHGGAAVYALTGGHSDPTMLGTALVDFETGAWAYLAPGNGIAERVSPVASGEMNGSPYHEINGATIGQQPSPPHPYGNRAYLNEGSKGSVVYIGRGACDSGGNVSSVSIHKMSLADRVWYRAGNDVLNAPAGGETSYAYDPTTNRYYYFTGQFHNENKLVYWDPVTQTCGQTTTFTAITEAGSSPYKRAFIDNDLRVLFFHHGPVLWAMDLNNIGGGWVNTGFSGTCPSSGNHWVKCNGAWWYKESKTDDNLIKYLPGANPRGGTGAFSTVAIGGAGTPDYFGTDANHMSALMAVPALGPNYLAWIGNGGINDAVIIRI